MEKIQIVQKMAKVLIDYTKKKHITASTAILTDYAEELYEEGYRKQSELVQEIADFIYDGEIEGLNIEMNGRYLGKNDFIKEFTTPKGENNEQTEAD